MLWAQLMVRGVRPEGVVQYFRLTRERGYCKIATWVLGSPLEVGGRGECMCLQVCVCISVYD